MAVDVLLGLQWGDEGKGKIVDFLAKKYRVVARFQGGPNAGHTLYYNGNKIVLHHIPSGIFHNACLNVIGNGVVIDAATIKEEIATIKKAGVSVKDSLFIARKAHLIIPTHKLLDAASEVAKGKDKIGSTLRGIGPTYMDKIGRNGLRVGDITLANFEEYYNKLKSKHESLLNNYYNFDYKEQLPALEKDFFEGVALLRSLNLVDGEYFINEQLAKGEDILAEGAQGSMLDIDFGTYPYVTSSNTITAGVCNGLGVAPQHIGEVIGITKAYCTRVGSGPFPTELHGDTGEELRKAGSEFGATTGRPRRCGWIDLPALRYAIMINGVTQVVMTKVDILNHFKNITACTAYNINGQLSKNLPYDMERQAVEAVYENFEGWTCNLDNYNNFESLPLPLKKYIDFVESQLDVNISILSVGPERDQLIHKSKEAMV